MVYKKQCDQPANKPTRLWARIFWTLCLSKICTAWMGFMHNFVVKCLNWLLIDFTQNVKIHSSVWLRKIKIQISKSDQFYIFQIQFCIHIWNNFHHGSLFVGQTILFSLSGQITNSLNNQYDNIHSSLQPNVPSNKAFSWFD